MAVAQRAILGRALRALVPSPTGHTPRSTGGAPATGAANPAAVGGSGKATTGLRRGAGQQPDGEAGSKEQARARAKHGHDDLGRGEVAWPGPSERSFDAASFGGGGSD